MRLAAEARARLGAGWPIVISPLMQTVWRDVALDLAGVEALIFTSETAVRAFCRLSGRRDLPAWCVGGRTAAVAGAEGFSVTIGPGEAEGLAATIRQEGAARRFLWPHGAHRSKDLAILLDPAGIETVSVEVYTQGARPLTDEARALLSRPGDVILPLFSVRSARLLHQALDGGVVARLRVAAISAPVAAVVAEAGFGPAVVAVRPDADAMLAAICRLADETASG